MRLSNLLYLVIVCVLVSILFAQIHQLGYIGGAYVQNKEIKIQESFSSPENFMNWEQLSLREQSIVYFSGYLLLMLNWLVFVILVPKGNNPIILFSKLWGTVLIFGYQLWIIASILSINLGGTSFGPASKAINNCNLNSTLILGLSLIIFLLSLLAFYKKKFKKEDIMRILVARIEFYREINILAGLMVFLLFCALILSATRLKPLTFFKFDLKGPYYLSAEYPLEKDLIEGEIYSFELKQEKNIVLEISLNNINSQYLELVVTDGKNETTLIQDDNVMVEKRTIEAKLILTPGIYKLKLTSFNNEINNSSITIKVNIY